MFQLYQDIRILPSGASEVSAITYSGYRTRDALACTATSRLPVAPAVLAQEQGFALELASRHQARDCTGADTNRLIDLDSNGYREALESSSSGDGQPHHAGLAANEPFSLL